MDKIAMTLTVYFEEGFWHGLFEQEHAQSYRVCRVTFGAEPSTQELLDFLNRYYHRLQFSPSIRVKEKTKSVSPKRLQRQAKKEQMSGLPTAQAPAHCFHPETVAAFERRDLHH